MARHSQNGYESYNISLTSVYTVSDRGVRMRLRTGSCGEMQADFFRWFDREIKDIDLGIPDDWSYAERPIRGDPSEDSNHSSGTAGDVDATKWPLGAEPRAYLSQAQIDKIHAKLKEYEGCIRWGGDYYGRKDPMHFEIDRDQASCDQVWAKIEAARAAKEWDEMATKEEIKSALREVVAETGPKSMQDVLAHRVRTILRDIDAERTFGVLLAPINAIKAKLSA